MKKIVIIFFLVIIGLNISAQIKPIIYDNNYECSCTVNSVNGMPIYTIVEEMPSYIGGEEARVKFLQENIVIPANEKGKKKQYKIMATFVIDMYGNLTNICVLNRKYTDAENEIMRVLSIMPRWNPGKNKGKALPVKMVMPVNIEY